MVVETDIVRSGVVCSFIVVVEVVLDKREGVVVELFFTVLCFAVVGSVSLVNVVLLVVELDGAVVVFSGVVCFVILVSGFGSVTVEMVTCVVELGFSELCSEVVVTTVVEIASEEFIVTCFVDVVIVVLVVDIVSVVVFIEEKLGCEKAVVVELAIDEIFSAVVIEPIVVKEVLSTIEVVVIIVVFLDVVAVVEVTLVLVVKF